MANEADTIRAMINQEQLPAPSWNLNWKRQQISDGSNKDGSNVTSEPPPSAISLHETLSALNTFQTEIASQQALAQININKQKIAQDRLEQDQKEANDISTRLEGKKLDEEQKTLGQVHDLQRAYGVDPNDALTYMLTSLGETSRQATKDYLEAAKELQDRETVSFWDSPLDWIAAQYTIKGQRDLTSELASKAQTADDRLRSMTTAVNAGAEQITLANKSMDDGDKANRLQLFKLAADAKLADLQIKNFSTAIDSIIKLNTMTHQQAQLRLQQLDALQKDRQIAISVAHLRLSQAEFDWRKSEKEKNDKTSELMVDMVNLGAAGQGDSRKYSWADIQAMRQFPDSKARIDQYFEAGVANVAVMQQEGAKTDFRYVGKTPGEAALALAATGLPGAQGSQDMTKLLITKLNEVKRVNPLDKPDQIVAKVNTLIGVERSRWISEADSADSLIAVKNLQIAFAGDSALKQTPYYNNILKPLVENGKLANITSDNMRAIATKAIIEKQTTIAEASQFLSHFYAVGLQQQQIRNNFSGSGIAPIKAYNTTIKSGPFGGWFNSHKIDATNETQWKHALNVSVRMDKASPVVNGVAADPFAWNQ